MAQNYFFYLFTTLKSCTSVVWKTPSVPQRFTILLIICVQDCRKLYRNRERQNGGGGICIHYLNRGCVAACVAHVCAGCQLSYIFLKMSWVLVLPNVIELTSIFMYEWGKGRAISVTPITLSSWVKANSSIFLHKWRGVSGLIKSHKLRWQQCAMHTRWSQRGLSSLK